MYVFCRTSLASRFVCSGRTERKKFKKESLQLFDENSFADVFPCQCRLHVFHCVNRGKQMALHDEINAPQIIEAGLDAVYRLRCSFGRTPWNSVTDVLFWMSRDSTHRITHWLVKRIITSWKETTVLHVLPSEPTGVYSSVEILRS